MLLTYVSLIYVLFAYIIGCQGNNVSLKCNDSWSSCPNDEVEYTCIVDYKVVPQGFHITSSLFDDLNIYGKKNVNDTIFGQKGFHVTLIKKTPTRMIGAFRFRANILFRNQTITCQSFANDDAKDSCIIQYPYPPSSPKKFSHTSKTYSSVIVSWNPPDRTQTDPPITGYLITISPKPKHGRCKSGRCPLINESAENYTIHHLKFGVKYTITITALNCIGRGDDVSIEVQTIAERPHINANVTVIHDTSHTTTSNRNESDFIEISWNIMESNRQPPINSFKIELDHDNRKIYNVAYSVSNHAHIFPIKCTDDIYVARLIAENAKGRSVVSKRISNRFPFNVNTSLYDANTIQIDCISRRPLNSCTVTLPNGTTSTKQFGKSKIISFQFSRNNSTEFYYTVSTEVIRRSSSVKTFYRSRHVHLYKYKTPINTATGTNTTVATGSYQRCNVPVYILVVMVVTMIIHLQYFY